MKKLGNRLYKLLFVLLFLQCHKPVGDSSKFLLGAYYFDGWTGLTNHITKPLVDSFPERQPIWGWITSTPHAIENQINYAADNGIDFFNFCWYYTKTDPSNQSPLNNALRLYLSSPNKRRLRFSLLIANHQGHIIGPDEFDKVSRTWIQLFKDIAGIIDYDSVAVYESRNIENNYQKD